MDNFLKNKKNILFITLLILLIGFFAFNNFLNKPQEISKNNIEEVIKFNLIKDSVFASLKIASSSDYLLNDLSNDLQKLISKSALNLISKSLSYNNNSKGFYISYFLNQKLEKFYFDMNLNLFQNGWKVLISRRIANFGTIEAENKNYKILFNINDNSKENIDLIFIEIYVLNK